MNGPTPKEKMIQKGMVSSMENFEALKAQYQEELKSVNGKEELGAFWQKYLGKTGQIQDLMKKMKDVPKEEKPEYGKKVNEVRTWAQDLYQAKADEIKLQEEELCAGAFFERNNLPELPGKLSLARKLMDDWLGIRD